ncbi:antibiotic ABC transporter permease [Clostridia bacterium]|nr:antibiotic ABC transporter permease [Clostridia bacterium]
MSKFFRIHLPFARAGVQETITYRTNFIFFMLGDLLKCIVAFFLWVAVFDSSGKGVFQGFTMQDMVLYIFITFLTSYLTNSDGAWLIADEIRDGSIAMRLIKPIKFDMPLLFQELGGKIISLYLVFVPAVLGVEIYRWVTTGSLQFKIGWFLLYLVSIALAYLIDFYFNLCFGFFAFLTKYMWGLQMVKGCIIGFLSGAVIPLQFMPAAISGVLKFLPFASLSYTPVMIYMGKYSLLDSFLLILYQGFWVVFFIVLSKFIWHFISKHLSVQGG